MRPWRSHNATATGSATLELHVVRAAEHGEAVATGSRVTATTTPTLSGFAMPAAVADFRRWLAIPAHRRREYRAAVEAVRYGLPSELLDELALEYVGATGCTVAEAVAYTQGFTAGAACALVWPLFTASTSSTLPGVHTRRRELVARHPSPPSRKPRPRSASKPRRPCAALTALHAHAPPRARGVKAASVGGAA